MLSKEKGQNTSRYLEDFSVGEKFVTPSRTISEADAIEFGKLVDLDDPLHVDPERAKQTQFKSRIVQGRLVGSILSGLVYKLGLWSLDSFIVNLGHREEYVKPVRIGDTIRTEVTVKSIRRSESKHDRGVLTLEYSGKNQNNDTVCNCEVWLMLKTKSEAQRL
jgi:acyl dehydratase